MPNSYFQFKQFTIHQQHAALKVSTDSCLFGAWAINEINHLNNPVESILDIGAGTGLLMLMLAQKSKAMIDGIEIHDPSYQQALSNIADSLWSQQIRLFAGDVTSFSFSKKYDFIISNPPFYEKDLKSSSGKRNLSMHDEGLTFADLFTVADKLLKDEGMFAVLLPYHRVNEVILKAQTLQLHLKKRTDVKQSVNHSFFRTMLLFDRKTGNCINDTISIKDEMGNYTESFISLLKDYYLYL